MRPLYVVSFSEVDKDDIALVGGKGANLGEMTKHNFPVPPGFIITSLAYYLFLKENKLDTQIKHLLETVDFHNQKSLEKVSKDIKDLFMKAHIPSILTKQIYAQYKSLGGILQHVPVAVRSSATAEDLPSASFAGQQESFLNVKGEANLFEKVKEVWASLFDARAIFYRYSQKMNNFKIGMAIPVQKMVASDTSGVIFTLDPITNDKSKIIIEAIYGLGEYIVQGEVTPDHYEVEKKTGKLLTKKVVVQTKLLEKAAHGNKKSTVVKYKQKLQKISDEQIKKLANIATQIEKHYYFPQDIEWAIEKGTMYILQTRPITTIKKQTKSSHHTSFAAPLLLSGDPASPGIGVGNVRILHSIADIGSLIPGEVLVAKKTNPDFVPAMKKASAIVTNEGGRTCFAGSTHVLTNMGFIPMEDLYTQFDRTKEILIFSYDYSKRKPAWKRVVSTQKNYLETIRLTVSQTGRMQDNTIDVTPDHRFFTYDKRTLIKKSIRTILAEQEMVCLIDSLPQRKNNLITSNKLAYLLGALATDGNIYLTKGVKQWRRGVVTLTQKQEIYKQDFIQTVNTYFSEIYNYSLRTHEKHSSSYIGNRLISGTATDFRCYSLSIALQLTELLKDLPILAASFTQEAALYFLAGVLDGDGSFSKNRIQLYASKKNVYESIIISCLRLGIFPQVTTNQTIFNIQILERMADILSYSKKIKQIPSEKVLGNKLFSAKQLFMDISSSVNYKGRIKPYIEKNLLIDARKITKNILPHAPQNIKNTLENILTASIRMQRIKQIKNLGLTPVYNIEVEADDEMDHNYIVFTKRYTPLLVSNSHAAIVSREMGIPAVVGTQTATDVLKNGMLITVNGTKGEIYKGSVAATPVSVAKDEPLIHTATKVYTNLGQPEAAERVAKLPVDGVGLLRAEFIMADIGTHPKQFIKEGKKKEFVEKLAEKLELFCSSFSPRPVVYRTSDFKTNEYRNLRGGDAFEPHEENPMLGYRGAFRYMHDPEVFALELEAIKLVREKKGLKNLWIMLPFVRTVQELIAVKKLISQAGLFRSATFKIWMMVEIPSNVILLDKFLHVGIDGVSIGSNDLTMLLLGADRDNHELARVFDEQNEAVLWALEKVITTCHQFKVTSSLCGQAASQYPTLLEKLVKWGITSVSVSPDVAVATRRLIAEMETKLLKKS